MLIFRIEVGDMRSNSIYERYSSQLVSVYYRTKLTTAEGTIESGGAKYTKQMFNSRS